MFRAYEDVQQLCQLASALGEEEPEVEQVELAAISESDELDWLECWRDLVNAEPVAEEDEALRDDVFEYWGRMWDERTRDLPPVAPPSVEGAVKQ